LAFQERLEPRAIFALEGAKIIYSSFDRLLVPLGTRWRSGLLLSSGNALAYHFHIPV